MPALAIYESAKQFYSFDECAEDDWTNSSSYYTEVAESRQDYHELPVKTRDITVDYLLRFFMGKNIETDVCLKTDAYEKWHSAFEQLSETQKPENYSPDLSLPTESAIEQANYWLIKSYEVMSSLAPPAILPDGSGELRIRWERGEKRLTIFIRKENSGHDRISYFDGEDTKSFKLNAINLKEILTIYGKL